MYQTFNFFLDQPGSREEGGETEAWEEKAAIKWAKLRRNLTIFNIIHWVDCLIDQASDGPSIILID